MTFHIKKSQNYEHYNRALGSYVTSKRDYEEKMKKAGCEPYNPEKVLKKAHKPYTPSKDAREIVRHIQANTDKDGIAHISGKAREWIITASNAKPRKVPSEFINKGGIRAERK